MDELAEVQEGPQTSGDIADRPFLIDGVPLDEAQVLTLANLVAGTAHRGAHHGPYTLSEAIDVWRRHNCVVTESSGRQRWRIHSASPTFREDEAESSAEGLTLVGEFLGEAGPEGREWDVVLIREGWSSNGRYYPREVLEQALPLFEGAPITMHGWEPEEQTLPHLPEQVRQGLDGGPGANVVGFSRDVYGAVAESGQYEVRARFISVDERARQKMSETYQNGRLCTSGRDLFGLSIDARGELVPGVAEGRRGYIVRSIDSVNETTIVSNPAAGGRFSRLVAAQEDEKEETRMDTSRIVGFLRRRNRSADGLEGKALCEAAMREMSDEVALQIVRALLDKGDVENAMMALDAIIGSEKGEEKPELPALEDPMLMAQSAVAEAVQAAQTLKAQAEVELCGIKLSRALSECKLPDKAQDALRKRFSGKAFTETELTEAVAEMRNILAINAGGQAEVQQSRPSVQVGIEESEKVRAGVDLCVGYNPDADKSLTEAQREVYRSVRGGRRSIRRLAEQWHGVGDYLDLGSGGARPGSLQEATASDFANVLGVSMEKAVIQKYREFPRMLDEVVSVNPDVDNFKTQTRLLWGGFAGLPTVTESDSADNYSSLGFPREEAKTYTVGTRGGLVTVTRTMLVNDDLGALRDIPARIASGARNQENLFRFNLLVGNVGAGGINTDTTYDGAVLYHANHRNTATTALSHASFLAARRRLQNQQGFGVSSLINDATNISDSDTTIVLDSTAGLFAGQYIQIEAEIVKIGSVTNSTTLADCVRGQMGTTAAAHNDDTRVYQLTGPIPLSRIYAVVPYELEATLMEILGSERVPGVANNDLNFLRAEWQNGRVVPLAVPSYYLGGDLTNWYLACPAMDIPCLEMAYLNNRQEPEILVQDDPRVGNVFTRDNIRYKVRHEYGGAAVDFRGLDGNIVA